MVQPEVQQYSVVDLRSIRTTVVDGMVDTAAGMVTRGSHLPSWVARSSEGHSLLRTCMHHLLRSTTLHHLLTIHRPLQHTIRTGQSRLVTSTDPWGHGGFVRVSAKSPGPTRGARI
jgi:hypothetical protein